MLHLGALLHIKSLFAAMLSTASFQLTLGQSSKPGTWKLLQREDLNFRCGSGEPT